MTLLHTATFSSWARGHLLCRVEDVADRFALTFDDGPSGSATPRILDLLARYGGSATFFTLAGNADRHGDLLRRMVSEGHEVALHGDIHWPMPILPPWLVLREIQRSAAAVARATSVRTRHYRPPFGLMLPSQARFVAGLGYRSVLGDVYPEDPQRPGTARIVRRVLARLRPGSIVILHDGSPFGEPDRSQTVAALESILQQAHERGWRAVSVAELLAAVPAALSVVEASLSQV